MFGARASPGWIEWFRLLGQLEVEEETAEALREFGDVDFGPPDLRVGPRATPGDRGNCHRCGKQKSRGWEPNADCG